MVYRYLCTVEYDGTCYCGWQVQNDLQTIQFAIENALYKIVKKKIEVVGASRTDTGVHAYNQNFHIDLHTHWPEYKLQTALNHFLNSDIYVHTIKQVNIDFHARYNVTKKEYEYAIMLNNHPLLRNRAVYVKESLNIDKMKQEIAKLVGEFDFSAFCSNSNSKSKVRKILKTGINKEGDLITFNFVGTGFLRYMIRILVGTLIEIGMNKKHDIMSILNSKRRVNAGKKMPAAGLYLRQIWYQEE